MKELLFVGLGCLYSFIITAYIGLDNMMMDINPELNIVYFILFYGFIFVQLLILFIDLKNRHGIKYVLQILILFFIIQIYEIYGYYRLAHHSDFPWLAYPIAVVSLFYIIKQVMKWRNEMRQENKTEKID